MKRRKFIASFSGGFAVFGLRAFLPDLQAPQGIRKGGGKKNSRILVKVLGTAQDGGLPHAGCNCVHCRRARKETRFARLISSLGIIDSEAEKAFLVDATPDLRIQLHLLQERLGLEKQGSQNGLDGVLVTHAHIGHYTGLMFFGYESMSTQGLPVHASERMHRFLAENAPWDQLLRFGNIAVQTIPLNEDIPLTDCLSFSAFPVPHRDEYTDTLGFLFSGPRRKLLYIPDIQGWQAWERSVEEEVEKVDVALLDGTFFSADELPGRDLGKIGHPFILDSMRILSGVVKKRKTEIYFTHLNHTNLALPPESEARRQVEERGFSLASEGMEFPL